MRISAVILECNPFHEGHRYVLQKARENADFVIAVMSGDFCERGIPAVFPKEVRTGDVLCGNGKQRFLCKGRRLPDPRPFLRH